MTNSLKPRTSTNYSAETFAVSIVRYNEFRSITNIYRFWCIQCWIMVVIGVNILIKWSENENHYWLFYTPTRFGAAWSLPMFQTTEITIWCAKCHQLEQLAGNRNVHHLHVLVVIMQNRVPMHSQHSYAIDVMTIGVLISSSFTHTYTQL